MKMITRDVDINDEMIEREKYAYTIIDPIAWDFVDKKNDSKSMSELLNKWTKEQQYVFAIESYRTEINSEGHEGFFSSSWGELTELAIEALHATDLDSVGKHLIKASDFDGKPPSQDFTQRFKQVEKKLNEKGWEYFYELDTTYYALEVSENMDEKLMNYIRKNKEKFYFKGKVTSPHIPEFKSLDH